LERLVELALVVPLEVGNRIVDAVPTVVDKVPSAADRVRREVVLARFLGKLAVDQGVRELRARLTPPDTAEPDTAQPTDTGAPAPQRDRPSPSAGSDATAASEAPVDTTIDTSVDTRVDTAEAAGLALVDYDHLSSAQIVAKLDGLDAVERDDIERYEREGRHRRTILGKLAQLRELDGGRS